MMKKTLTQISTSSLTCLSRSTMLPWRFRYHGSFDSMETMLLWPRASNIIIPNLPLSWGTYFLF